MNIRKILFVILSILPGSAFAQSSVTLYGRVNSGITYVNNTGSSGSMVYADSCAPPGCNEWGLKGSEDLGGGTRAIFTIESGFALNNGKLGQGGLAFGRQAFVGISDERFGTVTLGRQYDTLSMTVGYFPSSNNFASGYGSHFGDLDNLNQSIRINNAIKYVSPSWGGFHTEAMYSFGGVAGDFSQNQVWSLAGAYAHGPFSIAAGYLYVKDPATKPDGSGGVYAASGSYLGSLGNYVGLQDASSMKVFATGGSYTYNKTVLAVTYSHTVLTDDQYFAVNSFPGAASGSSFRMDSFEASVQYQFTPAMSLGAAYIYNLGKTGYDDLKPVWHQLNLGASYSISKLTSLYAIGTLQIAAGDGIAPVRAANGTVIGRTAVAEIPGLGLDSSTSRQMLVSVGIIHNF
jgi:predicted porin